MFGTAVPYGDRFGQGARQGLRTRRGAPDRRQEELPVSEWFGAGLRRRADVGGIQAGESECQTQLRMRGVIHGMNGDGWRGKHGAMPVVRAGAGSASSRMR